MTQPSHRYRIGRQGWDAYLAGWCGVLLLAASLFHGGVRLRLLPAPRPSGSIDETLIVHQVDASRAPSPARWILAGDSSCMMNVDAKTLAELLDRGVLNLGLTSYLGPEHHARLVREFIDAHPGQLRGVILLMHPEALRRSGAQSRQAAVFDDYIEGRDGRPETTWSGRMKGALGLSVWEQRVQSRWLPRLLPGPFGREYGFNWDLERRLSSRFGSALEPARVAARDLLRGNPDYSLHPALVRTARSFTSGWPADVQLIVGITPLPEGFPNPDYETEYAQLLHDWAEALGTNLTLTELPSVLPASLFATKTHLAAEGQALYTRLLAQTLLSRIGLNDAAF